MNVMLRSSVLLAVVVGCLSRDDARPCDNNNNAVVSFIPGVYPGEEKQYILGLTQTLPAQTKITMKFDSEAHLELGNREQASLRSNGDTVELTLFKRAPRGLELRVQGDELGSVPYLRSLVINSIEYCEYPNTGYLDHLGGTHHTAAVGPSHPPAPSGCGRRMVDHTELIVHGYPTKPGDWPWHAAIFVTKGQYVSFTCGGTLISRTIVLTAAHCVWPESSVLNPEILAVYLGKHQLIGDNIAAQERQVLKIVVHEHFDKKNLHNDITLLKLKTEAVYSNYVQPACLWSSSSADRLGGGTVIGTVVGWGLDHTDKLSSHMQQTVVPMVPESVCTNSKPDFYYKVLTTTNFCGGYANGTSACQGDSGGGYIVFVPDSPGSSKGTYHVRGVVSVSPQRRDAPYCDPYYYTVFTDVSKYTDWIARNIG